MSKKTVYSKPKKLKVFVSGDSVDDVKFALRKLKRMSKDIRFHEKAAEKHEYEKPSDKNRKYKRRLERSAKKDVEKRVAAEEEVLRISVTK